MHRDDNAFSQLILSGTMQVSARFKCTHVRLTTTGFELKLAFLELETGSGFLAENIGTVTHELRLNFD